MKKWKSPLQVDPHKVSGWGESCHGVSIEAAPQQSSEEVSFLLSALWKKLFRAHFWWYPCNSCLVTKGFARAIHFQFEIKYLNTSSSCAYLARSELLQTLGRTPGQWSVSSLHIACQELCQKAILAISLGLMKKDLRLPLHVLEGDPATTIIVIWSCQE